MRKEERGEVGGGNKDGEVGGWRWDVLFVLNKNNGSDISEITRVENLRRYQIRTWTR